MKTLNSSVRLIPDVNSTHEDYYHDYYEFYEYDANSYSIPVEQLVPVSIVYGLTMILGVIGNTLVIVSVARFKKMQNVTNMFLLSLASADLLLVLICVPVKVINQFIRFWYISHMRQIFLSHDIPSGSDITPLSINIDKLLVVYTFSYVL